MSWSLYGFFLQVSTLVFENPHWFKLKRSQCGACSVILEWWQIWCTPNTRKPTHQKNRKKPPHWDVSGLWAGAFSEIAKTAIKLLRRIKNMYSTNLNNTLYQCLKSIYSYKKVLLLLTTSPYKMSLHTLLSSFLFFLCSITASWAYKKPQKDKLNGLIKWLGTSKLLQNEHLKIHNFAFWVPCYKKAWLGVFL